MIMTKEVPTIGLPPIRYDHLLMAFLSFFFSASKWIYSFLKSQKMALSGDKLNTKSGSPLTMLYNQLDSTFDNSVNDNP